MSLSLTESTIAGRYQILARIATGGMGEVYRAHDAVLGREVALKVLHPQFASDPGFVERFRREARAAAVLNHPNIVGVYDWGSHEGTYFMVMEYVPGHNLRTLLTRYGRLEPAQVVEAAIPVLAALNHAHGHGIVHRDIKPENILIARDGTVKVADFGLARALAEASVSHAEGTVTGTVQYLAPEQIQGEPADPRTDLYALGVVMFELLAGVPPYRGETSLAIAYKHLSERVPPPSSVEGVDPALDAAVVHATAGDRTQRTQSARAMAEEVSAAGAAIGRATSIRRLAAEIPPPEEAPAERAPTVSIRPPAPPARRRSGGLRGAAWTAVILALLAVAGWVVWTTIIPHYETVPPVKGLAAGPATVRVQSAGLAVGSTQTIPSMTVPSGHVVRTVPASGSRVRKGSTVTLYVSTGRPTVPVPSVGGLSQAQAAKRLRDAGFRPVVERAYSGTVALGVVISQNPNSGSPVQKGSRVTIEVSRGPRPIPVPDVRGDSAAQAASTLTALGFKVGNQTTAYSTTIARGDVISSDPAPGARLPKGQAVDLVVSKGPATFAMPNVVGKDQAEATATLKADGLYVKAVRIPGSPGGVVVFQSPIPHSTVHQGQTVTIYVA